MLKQRDRLLPLVVILGPTASGKTSLAIDIAKDNDGEIICADSRTVFKGMDIGTAKPDKDDLNSVPHWGIDLVEPGDYFSVSDFKDYATAKIAEIRSRGKVPFLVGGSGLYIDSIIFNYEFGNMFDSKLRSRLEKMTVLELQEYCNNNNISLPKNTKNKRHLTRAIELNGQSTSMRQTPINNTIIVGISTERDILRSRIKYRIEQMINNGVVDEAKNLAQNYGWDSEAMKGNIYRLLREHIENGMGLDEVIDKAVIADWHLVKRQYTWFKRNKYINWYNHNDAEKFLRFNIAKIKNT